MARRPLVAGGLRGTPSPSAHSNPEATSADAPLRNRAEGGQWPRVVTETERSPRRSRTGRFDPRVQENSAPRPREVARSEASRQSETSAAWVVAQRVFLPAAV